MLCHFIENTEYENSAFSFFFSATEMFDDTGVTVSISYFPWIFIMLFSMYIYIFREAVSENSKQNLQREGST